MIASGDGCTDDEIALACVTVQQREKGTEHGHERSRAFLLTNLTNDLPHSGGNTESPLRARRTLDQRSRFSVWHFEDGGRAIELLLPVRKLLVNSAAAQPFALPG